MSTSLIQYYDTHPINEVEIEQKLRERGYAPDSVTQRELAEFDQDHYGGTAAVDALATAAMIGPDTRVLDVCCGLGGPARWLAFTRRCQVVGLDLTQTRVDSATRLAKRVGLAQMVRFECGDATRMPFEDASFDVVIGQEAWVHVPDKAAMLSEIRRVLVPDGLVSFTDIIERAPLPVVDRQQMAAQMQFAQIFSIAQYQEELIRAGFQPVQIEALSERWTQILEARLAMYRSLRDTTVARFGQAHHAHWDQMYNAFVDLYRRGLLGGVRMLAQRIQAAS